MIRLPWFFQAFAPYLSKISSLVVWGRVAYSAVSFLLHWGDSALPSGSTVEVAHKQVTPEVDVLAVSKALGAASGQSANASLSSRLALVGVMDGGPSQGVALISVDGKPAKPYRLGQFVSEGLVVVATGPKKAELGPQLGVAATLVVELPPKK